MNEFFESYFHIPYRERRGFILLSIIAIIMVMAIYYIPGQFQIEKPEFTVREVESLEQEYQAKEAKPLVAMAHLQPFDPNSAEQSSLEALGIPSKVAERIMRYRAKGGRFKEKEDLQKIYGMPPALYRELQAYIQFDYSPKQNKQVPLREKELINLNTADSGQLESLPMIGAGRARLIIKYRNALGGFVRLEQLREVWGINDTVYSAIKPLLFIDSRFQPELLVPDSSHAQALFRHPYLRPFARSLLAYYKQHKCIPDSSSFCKQFLVQDSIYNRLKIYLKQPN